MKIALVLLSTSAVAGIGALLILIFGQSDPETLSRMEMQSPVPAQEAPAPIVPPMHPVEVAGPIQEEVERLKSDNLDLRRKMAGLSQRLDALELELMEQNDSGVLTESDLPEHEQPSLSRSETGEIELATLTTALNAETPDSRWASTIEVEIAAAFQEGDQTSGDLIAADCRRTLCRAEVQFDTLADRNQGLERLPQLVAFADSAVALPQADSPIAYLFLARDGYDLPSLQD